MWFQVADGVLMHANKTTLVWMVTQHTAMNEGRQSSCSHSWDWDTTPMYWRGIRFYPITAHLITQLSVCCVESFGYMLCVTLCVFATMCFIGNLQKFVREELMKWWWDGGGDVCLLSPELCCSVQTFQCPLAEQPWHTHTHVHAHAHTHTQMYWSQRTWPPLHSILIHPSLYAPSISF